MGETARGTRGHNAYGSPPINDILILKKIKKRRERN
jgi:hypothetical protein